MKKDGKYRFNLQFPAETEEQVQAGELLERLGNRKSAVVVQALHDFLAAHPDLLHSEGKIQVNTTQSISFTQLEKRISEMLEERLGTVNVQSTEEESDPLELREVAEMLDNLDAFQ